MRVFDIDDLGYESAIVTIGDAYLLLLDTKLTQDERVDVMLGAMERLDA